MQTLRDWFTSLKPRERLMVSVGGIAVLFAALFICVAPFYKSIQAQSERVQRKQADLAWMRSVAPELQALGQNQVVTTPSDESLVVLIDRTARECGLGTALTGQTPNGETGIRVRLESAAFDVLVKCLGQLQQVHAVTIESATFDRTAKPGLVNANLVLNRAAG
ncbi:MAG: type II secretion system protein GspM [Povalibacter sp.]